MLKKGEEVRAGGDLELRHTHIQGSYVNSYHTHIYRAVHTLSHSHRIFTHNIICNRGLSVNLV